MFSKALRSLAIATVAMVPFSAAAEPDLATLGKKTANPVSDLWYLWTQHDSSIYDGDLFSNEQWVHNTKFQPVMTFPVNDGAWNLIVRPVFQFNSVPLKKEAGELLSVSQDQLFTDPSLGPILADPFGRTNGLGDTALMTIAGPNSLDGLIWAVGASQIFPTASEDVLGQGKYQVGPAALLVRIAPEPGKGLIESMNIGALVQHWWAVEGDDNRQYTNQTDIQYFLNYRLTDTKMIGMTPNIRINWEADDKWTVPIGLGFTDIMFWGDLPVRYAFETQYYVVQPDAGSPEWNFRLIIAPVIPRLFGGGGGSSDVALPK